MRVCVCLEPPARRLSTVLKRKHFDTAPRATSGDRRVRRTAARAATAWSGAVVVLGSGGVRQKAR